MKAPRTAHWLIVPTLALGMAVGPMRAHAAPAKPSRGEPKTRAKEAAEASKEAGAAPEAEATPEAGADPKPAPETGAAPEAGATTGAGAAPEAGAPAAEDPPTPGEAEAEPVEPAPEPEIRVQPRPVEPSVETSAIPSSAASREAVADPRRIRADDRILFRAGILSLGVAAAAVVPTVIGLQQANVAHREDDPARERTMRGLGIGAGIAAGTYAITGAVLLALGARQRRAAVAPAVGPGQLGAVLRARF